MAVRTASGGKADWSTDNTTYTNIPEVRTWGINPKTDTKEYASSTTAGAKKRIGGNDDFSGSVTLYVDAGTRFDVDASLGIKSGETGYLKLYEDTGNFFIAPVFIDDVDYTVDIEGGEIIAATINFSANGALTYPT